MKFEFESTDDYQKKHAVFYEAIKVLLHDQTAKINVNSVTKLAGYDRSAIRRDRDEWKPLLRDIEIANTYQLQKPHFQLKEIEVKNRTANNAAKDFKAKYLNILSAFYDLYRIVEDQKKTIDYLNTKIDEQSKIISDLSQENITLKTNGKVTDFSAAKNRKR